MRDKVVGELLKEVLGPRDGPSEHLFSDPGKEYITGVIIPKEYTVRSVVPDQETIRPSICDNQDDDEDTSVMGATSDAPSSLDPRMKPKSIGISFMTDTYSPELELCVTWGRYRQIKTDGGVRWERSSNGWTSNIIVDESKPHIVVGKDLDGGEVYLQVRRITQPGKQAHILVSLINNLVIKNPASSEKLAEKSLFQASIRINLKENTHLLSLKNAHNDTIGFLYRDKPVLARGHMCSAIWKEMDYPYGYLEGLVWPDKEAIVENCKFSKPDLRTEFVPIHPIPAPLFSWTSREKAPNLSALQLSEAWNPDTILTNLSPLIDGYSKWVNENEAIIERMRASCSKSEKFIIEKLLDKQKQQIDRMKSGLKLLIDSEQVRLAFCFANRTIWLQNSWKGKPDFYWRPFQLGFILNSLDSVCSEKSEERDLVDLLWIPTGGGKTEAYLALIAMVIALRRRRELGQGRDGSGTAVFTRYTLRLLTIQQFRRTSAMISAAEYLRTIKVSDKYGWRPREYRNEEVMLYGSIPFSCGIWVGGAVTPNHLRPKGAAIDNLSSIEGKFEGDPAQLTRCPVCQSWLSIPDEGIRKDSVLHLVFDRGTNSESNDVTMASLLKRTGFCKDVSIMEKGHSRGKATVTIRMNGGKEKISSLEIDVIWKAIHDATGYAISSFRASRPGYFPKGIDPGGKKGKILDFQIFCPNPECHLNKDISYLEGMPAVPMQIDGKKYPDGNYEAVDSSPFTSKSRIPIHAFTVDEQIYCRCPTVVIATADKIARLAFEPRAAAIFGNVDQFNQYYGYLRKGLYPEGATQKALGEKHATIDIQRLLPPELIIQDELHLIDGPLGSLFGLYENAVQGLLAEQGHRPKYIASTATIKNAEEQIKQLFARGVCQFPAYGLCMDDSFFVTAPRWEEAWNEDGPGRLYVGICSPGMGPLTPNIRIWSRLLKTGEDARIASDPSIRNFWTVVGYSNAIRELAGSRALYREDIKERLDEISGGRPRILDDSEKVIELSSRKNSTEIPQILAELESGENTTDVMDNYDALFTTSMFGTGVDISYLSLMIVNGQPKTTSQYIQATGRVGRSHGGLVITFLKSSRPRDMSHYELFLSYHSRIYMDVEAVSVAPYSIGALTRAAGPSLVSYLRNKCSAACNWQFEDGKVILDKNSDMDIQSFLASVIKGRASLSTGKEAEILTFILSEVDRWKNIATSLDDISADLSYHEYTMMNPATKNVVLGTPAHEKPSTVGELKIVFKNAPQSLREVEESTSFRVG